MHVRLLAATLLAGAVVGNAQAPAGRWDGVIRFGALKVPFRMDFEGNFKGWLVNGHARVAASSASFADGKLQMVFPDGGAKVEATLVDGELKGTVQGTGYGTVPFTAAAFCSCGFEGEAGPAITGPWDVAGVGWRLVIRREGEDTLATIVRPGDEIGPLAGRFDGLVFSLHYFDGKWAALLEMEPAKSGGLDLTLTEPGAEAKKLKATSTKKPQ